MPKLTKVAEDRHESVWSFNELLVIGADPDYCNLVLSGNKISKIHCEIYKSEYGDYLLEDLDSESGTTVNDERVKGAIPLSDEDVIAIGGGNKYKFVFQIKKKRSMFVFPLEEEIGRWRIGRDERNELVIDDRAVSSFHAVVSVNGGMLEIEDLGSLNGVFVNGKRVKKASLTKENLVTLGGSDYSFKLRKGMELVVETGARRPGIAFDVVCLEKVIGTTLRRSMKTILFPASFSFKPGELVGIVGPSGSGKSTLLKALSGVVKASSGSYFVNGKLARDALSSLEKYVGYVPQEDIVHTDLSVERTLGYIAGLKLPKTLTRARKMEMVRETLKKLDIDAALEQPVSSLSGGQRKRVSIAAELISNPPMLFLDEPTSGMDPYTEKKLMELFRRLADRGNTVLLTTHNLASLSMLDKLLVVVRGRVLYFGDFSDALAYFGLLEDDGGLSRIFEVIACNEEKGQIENLEKKYKTTGQYRSSVIKRMRGWARKCHLENMEQQSI